MSSKEDLIEALRKFEQKIEKETLDKKARADEFKVLISEKMDEIRSLLPEVNGVMKAMGPSVGLGGMSITSLKIKFLEKEVLISPHVVDDEYSIKIEGLFDGVQYFQYSDQEWIAKDDFLNDKIKLTPEVFYQQLIKLIPR